ncbi:hypothetical protein [Solidesulfovibrio sp.]|uniref:hypothetical protein n=1 Tax=Solidesulfovibrio sp. TaxID=2910990 RepID=UPI002637C919|nr:hypothetical protein [Solidesulfovibrio sp.]
MYHDEIAFDAMPLANPFDAEARPGPADALEQGFSDRLAGLLLASDLFAARNPGPRTRCDGAPLAACWDGADVRYCGERLDQDDLDAFLGCLLLAFRESGRSGAARFRLRDLTRLIRPKGRRFDARRLERSLWRLAGARIEIEEGAGCVRMQVRLLHTLLCDREAGICALDVNPRLMAGLRAAAVVERLLAARAPLGAAPFPRWLAALLSHGPSTLRLDMAALRRLSGLTRQPMPAFRLRAIAALQDFLDLGYVAAIEPVGPDRLVVRRPEARGEEPACLLLS